MKVIKASRGSAADMLDAMKSALNDAGVSASVNASNRVFDDTNGIFTFPGGTVEESELKEYWDNNYDDDPVLQHYDNYDEWLKDTASNMIEIFDEEDGVVESAAEVAADTNDYIDKLIEGIKSDLDLEFNDVTCKKGKNSLLVTCTYNDLQIDLDVPYEDLFMMEDKLNQDISYVVNSAIEELENSL